MFFTENQFEQVLPPALANADEKAWLALSLSTEMPWFLFSFAVPCGDDSLVRTMAVSWESTLMQLLRAVPASQHRGVSLVARKPGPAYAWEMHSVKIVWVASPSERTETGPLLLSLERDDLVRDITMKPHRAAQGRVALYKRSSDAQSN